MQSRMTGSSRVNEFRARCRPGPIRFWIAFYAAKRAGITKWVGFHTFRHTYSTLLKANGEDVKVVQELMRHANISTKMNIYTKALTSAKREAQSRVVDVLLDRSRNVVESAAEGAA